MSSSRGGVAPGTPGRRGGRAALSLRQPSVRERPRWLEQRFVRRAVVTLPEGVFRRLRGWGRAAVVVLETSRDGCAVDCRMRGGSGFEPHRCLRADGEGDVGAAGCGGGRLCTRRLRVGVHGLRRSWMASHPIDRRPALTVERVPRTSVHTRTESVWSEVILRMSTSRPRSA